jgi:hypothetical protein
MCLVAQVNVPPHSTPVRQLTKPSNVFAEASLAITGCQHPEPYCPDTVLSADKNVRGALLRTASVHLAHPSHTDMKAGENRATVLGNHIAAA